MEFFTPSRRLNGHHIIIFFSSCILFLQKGWLIPQSCQWVSAIDDRNIFWEHHHHHATYRFVVLLLFKVVMCRSLMLIKPLSSLLMYAIVLYVAFDDAERTCFVCEVRYETLRNRWIDALVNNHILLIDQSIPYKRYFICYSVF